MRRFPTGGLPLANPPSPEVDSVLEINGMPSGYAVPVRVPKSWGHEVVYANTPMYCSKLLFIRDGHSCSMHFHVRKHETLLVTQGTLTIECIVNKETHLFELQPGEAFVVAPGLPHKLLALHGDVELVESSTQHFDEDSVKVS